MTMSTACAQPLAARKFQGSRVSGKSVVRAAKRNVTVKAEREGPVLIGLAADSGCGKSTFMRRMTSLFGGKASPPEGGNPDSNTLVSDTTTVLCLDDYHLNDRNGRKESGLTALNLKEQNFGEFISPHSQHIIASETAPRCAPGSSRTARGDAYGTGVGLIFSRCEQLPRAYPLGQTGRAPRPRRAGGPPWERARRRRWVRSYGPPSALTYRRTTVRAASWRCRGSPRAPLHTTGQPLWIFSIAPKNGLSIIIHD